MNKLIVMLVLGACLASGVRADAKEKTVLSCSTDGFALAFMKVVDEGGRGRIEIQAEETDTSEPAKIVRFDIQSGLNDVKAKTSATVIASDGQDMSGGAFWNAVLLRVLDGQKKAVLAYRGAVYRLHCY